MYVKLCGPIVAVHNYERVCGLASAKAVRYVHMSARVHMSMFGLTCLVSLYTMIKLATFLNEQKKKMLVLYFDVLSIPWQHEKLVGGLPGASKDCRVM